ncbi:hypothetical protein WKI13_02190 [Teredinibacter turnerae]|uniref:hypothetical protein n=1 Tax=Teredinibacter turnerae TaxID=2426 RepID=UPI00036DF904|nr:hypothetical protein [Teredinibacter turnerae]
MQNKFENPVFEEAERDYVRPVLEQKIDALSEKLSAHITATGGEAEPIDKTLLSQISDGIYEGLIQMDDTPLGELVAASVYSVTDVAARITEAIYQPIAEHFGEQLTASVELKDIIENLATDIDASLDRGDFDGYFRDTVNGVDPFSTAPQYEEPQHEDHDYLAKHLSPANEADNATPTNEQGRAQGIER